MYYTDQHLKLWVHHIIRSMSKNGFTPDYIVGLTRGGLVPANMISQYLDIPMHTLKVSFRDDVDCGKESNCWMAEDAFGYPTGFAQAGKKRILIVDDINDTGATLEWIKQDWQGGCYPGAKEEWEDVWNNNVKFAVLINNEASKFKDVDYVGHTINKEDNPEWCVFPWEQWWS